MTEKDAMEIEVLRQARNEALSLMRQNPSPARRAEFNEAARLYQKRRIALDPEFAEARAEDSRRHRAKIKQELTDSD